LILKLIHYFLTYLLHGVESFLRSYPIPSFKKFPAFYGTRRFITAFISTRHLSLSWASSNRPIPPHLSSLRSVLPSTPGSPKRSLSFRFPHQIPVYESPLPHTRYTSRPSQSSRFYHPNNIE
jgi:hypothetical protein